MSTAALQLDGAVARRLAALDEGDVVRRVWQGDPTVWGKDAATPDLRDRLGWLRVVERMAADLPPVAAFAEQTRAEFDRVVLLGMGGSSLAPEVLWRAFGPQPRGPATVLLDSTHPAAVAASVADELARTLFVVASKSGTTLETDSLFRHCWDRTGGRAAQFVAITDPGTPLEALARERGFRHVFRNPPDIGGRFSALSLFGLVPAALAGIDVGTLLRRAAAMAAECGASVPAAENPGARLGAWLGEAALGRCDKVTFALSPTLVPFGLWLEQLLAESTGKAGTGVLPIVEPPGDPGVYGDDRAFVTLGLATERRTSEDARGEALRRSGHPMERIELDGAAALGAEFYRWEFATAVAGAILRVNPFDQPNVAESKRNTEQTLAGGDANLPAAADRAAMRAFLEAVSPGDYAAILAFVPPSPAPDRRLARVQAHLRDRLGAAVTVGYGPRYLHSTGQYHKGGPPVGHFIVVVDAPTDDLPVPGRPFSFGRLMVAQAVGDMRALAARGRPIARVAGLDALEEVVR